MTERDDTHEVMNGRIAHCLAQVLTLTIVIDEKDIKVNHALVIVF